MSQKLLKLEPRPKKSENYFSYQGAKDNPKWYNIQKGDRVIIVGPHHYKGYIGYIISISKNEVRLSLDAIPTLAEVKVLSKYVRKVDDITNPSQPWDLDQTLTPQEN